MTIVVHHLEYSRSVRILWLLEELELPYEIRTYSRTAEFRAPESLKKVHPLGRAPVVEADGHTLAESGAIIEYFAEREGKLKPQDKESLLLYRFFLHYAEGSAMPPLLVQLITDKLRDAPVPFFLKPVFKGAASKLEDGYSGPAIRLHFGFLDEELARRPFFAGEGFSAADIQMLYAVEGGLRRGQRLAGEEAWPNLKRWLASAKERPAYQRAEERGGPAMPPGAA